MTDWKKNLAAILAYEQRFPEHANAGDYTLRHPQLLEEESLVALIEEAIKRGKPLTKAEIEARFGPINWEW